MPDYLHETRLPFPVRQVFDWHMRPGALERLMPPWEDARVVSREGSLHDGGTVHIHVRRGPIKADWKVRHTDFEDGRLFSDEQTSGPFGSWRHAHEFDDDGAGGTILRDRIVWNPPLGAAAAMFAGPVVERELTRLFRFRADRLRHDLGRQRAGQRPLTVAITGSSGFVGSALRHFLTVSGHRVVPVVRRKADPSRGEISWDPMEGKIDAAGLEGLDAVVHLTGESLSGGRWTTPKKRAIWKSRVEGTRVLVAALNGLRKPPPVLVSASAVGYYGNRGDEQLTESGGRGKGFLAELCQEWETEAMNARRSGIRVVAIRSGLALSPAGGALGTMLLPFKLGIGGRLGGGRQYVSWIDHDDLVALYHRAIVDGSLRGPVNGTAPYPVTNAAFTSALGRVLSRPTFVPVPGLAVKALFGEMGQTLLLEGARVLPKRALESGFSFFYEGVEESLRFQLGHTEG